MQGYPLAMVYAEKTATAVERGLADTRWRDLADVYLLSRIHDQDDAEVVAAITTVAGHRGVALDRLSALTVTRGASGAATDHRAGWPSAPCSVGSPN